MCGILFVDQKKEFVSKSNFVKILKSQSWRGPDNTAFKSLNNNKIFLGHNRLTILDKNSRSNQPMESDDGRYLLIFNGEIYNYKKIIKKYKLKLRTTSDTEVVLKGFIHKGKNILNDLDGMFSFVIYDKKKSEWFCARDRFGIKPLFLYYDKNKTVIGSEPGSIAKLLGLKIDHTSILEWKLFRTPTPNYTFFKNLIHFPKSCFRTNKTNRNIPYYRLKKKNNKINFTKIKKLIDDSIYSHQMGDVSCTSLLSGGIDSTIILKNSSKVKRCYSVGLENNNEFIAASKIAKKLNKKISLINVQHKKLLSTWKYLTKLRKEPLSVPNEGLIYLVCKKMNKKNKIVLTGEGADEIFFGYDKIFRWALTQKKLNIRKFIELYGYSNTVKPTIRFMKYIKNLASRKKVIDFVEDFFYDFHLPTLLRRMDFASMAASKEARVPFVSKNVIENLYRKNPTIKINKDYSKIPLRKYIEKINLDFVLKTKKIGFSAEVNSKLGKFYNYSMFQNMVIKVFKNEYLK
jgi:asparagine synthase (glutamine-hydrolysing)